MARVKFPSAPVSLWGCIVLCISCVCATLIIHRQGGGSLASHQPIPSHQEIAHFIGVFEKLPLSFEPNRGQTDSHVRFLARGNGYTLFLTENGAVLGLRKPIQKANGKGQTANVAQRWLFNAAAFPGLSDAAEDPQGRETKPDALQTPTPNPGSRTPAVLRMQLAGANPKASATGVDELAGKSNYFIGRDPARWRTNVPTYAKLEYEGVYPGVDLVYYGNQGQLEYDFIVAPGANPRSIQLAINSGEQGGSRHKAVGSATEAQDRAPAGQSAIDNRESSIRVPLRIDEHGDLVVKIDGSGEVRFYKPVVYQVQSTFFDSKSKISKIQNIKKLKSVEGRYVLKGENRVGFEIADYDRSRPLVIDPVLTYSTYFGGSVDQGIFGITWDPEGNFYVAGETSSPDFPILNAFQPTLGGDYDGFVSKFDRTGSTLLYSTYLGGSQFDHCVGVTVDAEGSARVAGYTKSSDFPTFNALQPNLVGTQAAFVSRLDPSGSKLVFSTYLGGSSAGDEAAGIALDTEGNTYVTGETLSLDFPVTANAFQKVCDQGYISGFCFGDAFVTKFNPTGSKLVYSTYLGGNSSDFGNDITVDRWGAAYVTGGTESSNFPTVNPWQKTYGGEFDAFVTKIDPSGERIVYSTYLGGSNFDQALGIAVDVRGNAYVAGETQSTDFPTKNPVQPACAGPPENVCYDAFVTKFSSSGERLYYSTYLGGTGVELGIRLTVDALEHAAVTGLTTSTNFPVANAIQPSIGAGSVDAFLTEYNRAGSAYIQSTYLGGSSAQFGYGVNVDGAGNVWVTGSTSSLDFPLVHPYQGTYTGIDFDAYVSKIALAVPQSIGVLEGEVRNLVVEGILNHGRAQSLLVKLQKAREDVIEGDREDAGEELRAFTGRVEDYIGKGVLPLEQGGRLRSAALDIITRLCEK